MKTRLLVIFAALLTLGAASVVPSLVRPSERGMPDPIKDSAVRFLDDFTDEWALTSSEPVTGTSPWIGTALSSGTTAFSTDVNGAVCVLSGAATTDNSGSQIQGDVEAFALQTGKDMSFATRFKMSDATDNHFFAGFGITDTTFLDGADGTAALANTAALGFFKPDDSTTLYLTAVNTSVVGSTAVATITADTYVLAEFRVHGNATSGSATIDVWINGNYVTTVNYTGLSTTEMAITAASVSGSATGTITSTFDYIFGASER